MTHQPDDRLDAYLWDPSATPDPSVAEIERRLVPVRFDPLMHPLPENPPRVDRSFVRRRMLRSRWIPLAAAASLLVGAGIGFSAWRWSWPEGRAWEIRSAAGSPGELSVGATLQTEAAEAALVEIARIGTMQVGGNTTLTLRSTTSNRHRLAMREGTIRVRVWAPPASVTLRTPAGEVIDFGCEFELSVTPHSSQVRVTSGWVQLENDFGESMIPAGASSIMTTDRRPVVPVFDDAASGFVQAVRDHETTPNDEAPVERIVALARPRDVFTLLHLVQRGSPAAARLTDRAAQLFPPPSDVDPAQVAAGDVRALDRWMSSLPLPAPKGTWLWNWRDGFPWFSRDSR